MPSPDLNLRGRRKLLSRSHLFYCIHYWRTSRAHETQIRSLKVFHASGHRQEVLRWVPHTRALANIPVPGARQGEAARCVVMSLQVWPGQTEPISWAAAEDKQWSVETTTEGAPGVPYAGALSLWGQVREHARPPTDVPLKPFVLLCDFCPM